MFAVSMKNSSGLGWTGRVGLTGLLLGVTFLSGCVSRSSYDKVVDRNRTLQGEVGTLQAQNASQAQQLTRLQGAIRYTVDSDLLFAPGSWEMSADGKELIAKYAKQLAPTQQNRIFVTGYTDNAPIGAELRRRGVTSNQMLAEKRAESVAQFLVAQGFTPDLVSATGLGEANPVASNATPQGRAKNRRVELSLAPPA